MQRRKEFACEDCGTDVYRRMRSDRPNVCLSCGTDRMVRQNIELHERAERGDVEEFRVAGRLGGAPAHKSRRT